MLTEARVNQLLHPFALTLNSHQAALLTTYLELLLRWNRKINLTALRTPDECVTRHFGESLYLARWMSLQGKLLDIGSGAGFPGLALKIAFPQLAATLLEPVGKKRAFLKEVARECKFGSVEVRSERLDGFVQLSSAGSFDAATARAVGRLGELVPHAARCLRMGGRLCLWMSREQAGALGGTQGLIAWDKPIPLPAGSKGEIWVGVRTAAPLPQD
jgi:16S rRNA (guanine527-N7)-methyltransferase